MKRPAAESRDHAIPEFFTNPVVRPYLRNVVNWQGYIRFLGLPDRRENPDIIIDRLFVAPLLTRRYVSPEVNPEFWLPKAEPVLEVLAKNTPLVILGDPGAGKSTLLNMVAWMLSRPTTNALIEKLGWRLPLPMVLRELPVSGVSDFEGLLQAFLSHEMSWPLRHAKGRRYLQHMLTAGQAFLLLDGIDEIGDQRSREDLRKAVFDGFTRFPNCRWLLSSRIVGYDEVPFDSQRTRPEGAWSAFGRSSNVREDVNPAYERGRQLLMPGVGYDQVTMRYIAPFDDSRVTAFARNWYRERDAASQRAAASANHLIRAVHEDDSILRLARVPNLLTMMALIHRVEATLPHGRALLYERIAEAYLESIDKFRGIDSSPHDLPRKKSWLARIGFEMQRLRTAEDHVGGRNILVDYDTVLSWLSDEMRRGDPFTDARSAPQFLKIVARRSGLFLPRGEGRYAFVHLSFQEYFAAVALRREVTRLRWARRKESKFGFDHHMVACWGGESIWRETFAFLFELLALEEEDDWYADLLDCVFGEDFLRLDDPNFREVWWHLGQLLARLVVNSRSGLSPVKREQAIACCVRTQFGLYDQYGSIFAFDPMQPGYVKIPSDIFVELLRDDADLNVKVFTEIARQLEMQERRNQGISLWRSQISDLECLAGLTSLKWLDLEFTRVSDLSPLAKLTALQSLNLIRTDVSDIGPISNLTALVYLGLGSTPVSDIAPIGNLKVLQQLNLTLTKVLCLKPLSKLAALKSLFLRGTQISDISPIAGLSTLEELDLARTPVTNIVPVTSLTALENLDLSATPVMRLEPLSKLTALKTLFLSKTQVSDISPIAGLTTLQNLDLSRTPVSDIGPVASLTGLENLDLSRTPVTDISPIARLTALENLDLSHTPVYDISPIANLTSLKTLDLNRTRTSEIGPLATLTTLEELRLSNTHVSDVKQISDLPALCRISLQGSKVPHDAIEKLRTSRPGLVIDV